jgi:cytidine deaminase
MENELGPIEFPELVFATTGPIGVDMDGLMGALEACLVDVGYSSARIKLSDEMQRLRVEANERPSGGDQLFHWKMDYANSLRIKFGLADLLARIALEAIRTQRRTLTGDSKKPAPKQAYIVSQLKTPEEVDLLRKVYGRQFILIAAYTSKHERKERLVTKLRSQMSTNISDADLNHCAERLIERDANENVSFGQKLRDTFHLGDVFVDGLEPRQMRLTLSRFVNALFGKNDITPSKDEYGMYMARSASLRSADLSRQVGAAIFTPQGEVIVQGCNEVPKAFGGTYWDLEEPDHRDIKKGFDPNEERRREILRDVVERLREYGYLTEKALGLGTDAAIVDGLTSRKNGKLGALTGSRIMDLTEYGRIVHAEMSAICDAARLGRSVREAVLYCTTFPCHNCTKHILASGIKKVVYLEPYPKSQAKMLHGDEIEIETNTDSSKVSFVPFLGISPFRYRDIFSKGKRKREDGTADEWYRGVRRPMVDVVFPAYLQNEIWALVPIVSEATGRTLEAGETTESTLTHEEAAEPTSPDPPANS